MKAKNQDSLLVELQKNQMIKESMKEVKGGSIWDSSWTACTSTGTLTHVIDANGISHLSCNGHEIWPEEAIAAGDTSISCR
ncbi:MAG TPA: hypothetical protein PK563_12305 [Tenuifilaceae bacterium]|nr:hypothetical protein [Tenuifilaceae bacterium]